MTDAFAARASTRMRLALMVAANAAARLRPGRPLAGAMPFSAPDRLLAVPEQLVAGQSVRGADIYAGRFTFAGVTVETGGRSIFAVAPPDPYFARDLHEFGWLADLAAADTTLIAAHARSLIEQWLAGGRAQPGAPETVAACRLVNWLTHAPFLLEEADAGFRRRFFRALSTEAGKLRRDLRRMPLGLPRLASAIALVQVGLCLPDGVRNLSAGAARLAADLKTFVLPDGGFATRNPADLLRFAHDLVVLRTSYSARGLEAPAALQTALDRMLPMLRFLRHDDGTLALFNGMGATPPALLGAVLARDDAHGRPVLDARFSGYQRVEGGATHLIMDAGKPPPLALSAAANAGALSFELSVGAARIVVNCGAPSGGNEERRLAARKTAAHSTVSVGEASSARFLASGFLSTMLGPLVREGPRNVPAAREQNAAGTAFRASHDGYAARFGMIHERGLTLDAAGARLDGCDVLRPVRRSASADIVLAFHLHPDIGASLIENGRGVLLAVPGGEFWLFAAEGHAAVLEESIFFAAASGPRRSRQILVRLGVRPGARVVWSFARTTRPVLPPAPALS